MRLSSRALATTVASVLALMGTPLAAQRTTRRPATERRPDPDDRPARTAMSARSEADEPGEMDALTRELWAFARRTPYERAAAHAARAQARARARQPASASVARLPTGWALAPAGTQVEVGRLPYEAVPFGGRLVVLDDGYYVDGAEDPEVSVVDVARARVTATLRVGGLYPSAAVAGGALYVSGGSRDSVYRLDREMRLTRGYAVGGYAGPVAALDASRLAVATLVAPDSAGATGPGRLAVLNTTTGAVAAAGTVGFFPSAMQVVGRTLYVALVGEHAVAAYDVAPNGLRRRATLRTGRSPQALCADDARLYVVNSGSDDVAAVSLRTDSVVARYPVRFPAGVGGAAGGAVGDSARFGAAPTSCAVAGGRLLVTAAGLNAVAVLDAAAPSGTGPRGLVPTGWYPTKVVADAGRLLVLSAKGIRARRPNPAGPQAATGTRPSGPDYVLTLLRGSLGILADSAVDAGLAAWTRQVAEGTPLFSAGAGLRLPIRHVFYVVRENRSYDQVLGDLGRGDGDSTLTLFGEAVTPVAHQLAREFVTLDHFFADGEISVLGHSFTTSGYASPFLEWLGNAAYAGRYRGYPFGTVPAVFSPAYLWDALEAKGLAYRVYGEPYYLSTRLYRVITDTYGEGAPLARRFYAHAMALADSTDRGARFTALTAPLAGRAATRDDALRLLADTIFANALSALFVGDGSLARAVATDARFRDGVADFLTHYALGYPTWDLAFSDLDRAAAWKRDFERAARDGSVPALSYLWLPNDHTAGANRSFLNPFELVAQNDAALGEIVATISRSPVWQESLILVEEDDAQNGPDHVDATRAVALVAGPYVKRGAVVADRLDQLSALRTVELLLGLDPLHLGDALAAPMFGVFAATPDPRPFTPAEASRHLAPEDRERLRALRAARGVP